MTIKNKQSNKRRFKKQTTTVRSDDGKEWIGVKKLF